LTTGNLEGGSRTSIALDAAAAPKRIPTNIVFIGLIVGFEQSYINHAIKTRSVAATNARVRHEVVAKCLNLIQTLSLQTSHQYLRYMCGDLYSEMAPESVSLGHY